MIRNHSILMALALALAGTAGPVGAATLQQMVGDQQAAIRDMQKTIETQGALLRDQQKTLQRLQEKLRMDFEPAGTVPGSAAGSPALRKEAPAKRATEPASPSASDRLSMAAMKDAANNATMKYVDNLVGETADGNHRIFVGGRLQLDGAWAAAPESLETGPGAIGPVMDAVNVRRARFDIGGTLFRDIDFYTQFDFVNGFNAERAGAPLVTNVPAPTDLWVQFKNLPGVGTLRVGNQKEPLSFEHLASSRFLDFMERSSAYDAFVEDQDNGFKMGLQMFDVSEDQDTTWAVGVFRNTRNAFAWNIGDGEYGIAGRVSHTPVYEDEGRRLVHVGLGGTYRDLDDQQTRLRTRTLVRNGNNVQHTLLADLRLGGHRETRLVPELVVVNGPFTFQAEYYAAGVDDAIFPNVNGAFVGDVDFDGYYGQVLYFLTGEHRNYNRKTGAFGRVIPDRNANWGPDTSPGDPLGGAWMLAYRHGAVDLNDGEVQGGQVTDDTLGLNWFLDRDVKVQWNYTRSAREALNAPEGTIESFGTRLALDF